jgi:16S rRNA (adenine1518-N6/adenine1519-N6)-dimethyltransferase
MSRRLGQHFLKDKRLLWKVAASLKIRPGDTVIEIGPGHGELTKHLLAAKPLKLIAIERDTRLATTLKANLPDKRLEIIEGDALKFLPAFFKESREKSYKVVGNIPYYITGHLLRTLGELEPKPGLIVLTIQKEVAERVCAAPPKMNLLAASVQFWAKPTIEFLIKSGAFSPPPKVDSAVLKLRPSAIENVDPKRYYKLIKTLFKQPRKTILNNIACGFKIPKSAIGGQLGVLGINPELRPQNLTLRTILSLTSLLT